MSKVHENVSENAKQEITGRRHEINRRRHEVTRRRYEVTRRHLITGRWFHNKK